MTTAIQACPRCSSALSPDALACGNCRTLVYSDQLNQLGQQAASLEAANPASAAHVWRQALDLLPPDSAQYAAIANRIGALAAGFVAPPPYAQQTPPRPVSRRRNDPLALALAKTIGSMLLSIFVYSFLFGGWQFAAGFVLLILVHEMGHVVAMRYYGLRASPPIFIPFMGALINLRQSPPNAKIEAIVGIGGPIAGTIGALVCYALALTLPISPDARALMIEVSCVGFFLNLFNLVPVPPLDGGRITAAVSPWIWIPGVLALIGYAVALFRQGHFPIILGLILLMAFSRLRSTFSRGFRNDPYYRITRRATWMIGTLYVLLAVLLAYMFKITGGPQVVGF